MGASDLLTAPSEILETDMSVPVLRLAQQVLSFLFGDKIELVSGITLYHFRAASTSVQVAEACGVQNITSPKTSVHTYIVSRMHERL